MRTSRIVMMLTTLAPSIALAQTNFTIDPAQSNLSITITAYPPIGGPIGDTEPSTVNGTLVADLALPAYPFKTAQLTTLNAALQSPLSWMLSAAPFGSMNLTGTNVGFALPGANNTGMAGAPTSVSLDGTFTQTGNKLESRGFLAYQGTGLLGGISGNDDLSAEPPLDADFAGTITQIGSTIRAAVPIDMQETYQFQNGSSTIDVTARFQGQVVATATTTYSGWKVDADGDWSTPANWTNGAPPLDAVIGPVNTAPRTVSITSDINVRSLWIDSPQRWTVAKATGETGNKYLIFSGTIAQLHVGGGTTHRIDAPAAINGYLHIHVAPDSALSMASLVGTVGIARNDFVLIDGNVECEAFRVPRLNMASGVLKLNGAGDVSHWFASLIDFQSTDGRIDITDDGLGAGFISSDSTARSLVTSGKIFSSLAAEDARKEVGWAKFSQVSHTSGPFATSPPDWYVFDFTVYRWTWRGDTDLDGAVDFDDLLRLAQAYGTAGGWFQGDSNHDGMVDFDDLLAMAQNYGRPITDSFDGDWALALTMVPEPTTAGLLVLAAPLLRRRR